MSVLVGTASWSSKTLVDSGRFYPPGVSSAEARLRYYASRFPLVEVDSSYYAMPSAATAQLWAERTPDDFVMNVKAFRLFTGHQTSPTVLHKDIRSALPASIKSSLYYRDLPAEIVAELWRRFIEALAPLRASGRLGLVHFQFAPWLLRDAAAHAHVRLCVERMAGHTLSVEFRQRSWFDGEHATASTLAFERELGVVHTVVDGPQGFANSVPAVWEATHPTYALLRLHGRNADTWKIKGARDSSERFNYDYNDAELAALAQQVKRLAARAATTHVVFNNNMEDQGQRNAAALAQFLRG
ncbi:MAG TPA: DUF72 domain-containing protein [Burkholderiaceae bacterium]|nr:DUF72 domain-containing protein [Burkholderiaceae bacterium]